jgi:hypothetical protein
MRRSSRVRVIGGPDPALTLVLVSVSIVQSLSQRKHLTVT